MRPSGCILAYTPTYGGLTISFGWCSSSGRQGSSRFSRYPNDTTVCATSSEQHSGRDGKMEKGSLANLGIGAGSGAKGSEDEKTQVVNLIGAPDRNRTCNPWIRSPILYPIELRAHSVSKKNSRSFGKAVPRYTGLSEDPSTSNR